MSTMSKTSKMFAPLPPTYVPEIRRQSMGRLFGFCIQKTRESVGLSIEEAARLSGMELTEWMAIENGTVPQDINRLRAMADTMEISFDRIASMVLVCRDAWEL
jgi:ribosome-binding protein aMBF1 (putative translation factor)